MSTRQRRCATAPDAPQELLPPPFRCTSSLGGGRAVRVEACGELDLLTTPQLENELRDATASARLVVLDLHALTFIDSTGVHALEDASLQALLRGVRLVVSRAPGHVARILGLTGSLGIVELLEVDAPPSHLRLVE